jgi:hypothetical protein
MNPDANLYWNKVMKLHREGYPVATIQNILKNEGLDEVLITEALCKLKLILYKKKKSKAVIIMVVGAAILLIGFVMTVLLFHSNHSFDLFLYGFTCIGILLLGYGVYEMFQ